MITKAKVFVFINIKTTIYRLLFYEEPTHKFAIRAVFFCALTIFVGYKTHTRLPLIAAFLVGNGFIFSTFALVLFTIPRYLNMYDAFWYWCIHILANVVLTIIAIINYEKVAPRTPLYEDIILDDL